MDRNFQRALKLVLKHEGGWADHPKDPGGATNKGVTIATFRRYVKADATKADLKAITDAQVATVYYRHYWSAVMAADLPSGLDYAVFDYAVNSGPSRAAKHLQAVVGVKQDGRIGPKTLEAVSKKDVGDLINALCDRRMAFLRALKTWPTFRKGWTRRVDDVRRQALLWVGKPADIQKVEVEVEVEKPVVPEKVETKVKEKSDWWTWLTGGGGLSAIGLGWLSGMDWQAIVAGGAVLIVVIVILILMRRQIVAAVKEIKAEVDNG